MATQILQGTLDLMILRTLSTNFVGQTSGRFSCPPSHPRALSALQIRVSNVCNIKFPNARTIGSRFGEGQELPLSPLRLSPEYSSPFHHTPEDLESWTQQQSSLTMPP